LLVLLICTVIAGLSARTLDTVGARVGAATARGHGAVIRSGDQTAEIRWSAAGVGSAAGISRTDTVTLATRSPPVGTRTEVAYDPRRPGGVFIPGSAELAAVDRAASGVAFSALVAAVVLSTLGWQLITRRRLVRRAGQVTMARLTVARRVRMQSGLLTRSWFELEATTPGTQARRWIPVHFDPVLMTLPAPAPVRLHGDPRRNRLLTVEADGVWLHPAGPARAGEPPGRRIDSPTLPDTDGLPATGWRRQLRADAALVTPAPVVGLLWAFLDGGGVLTWACATALTAALALCWAALRGSDPS
jgi:hypothetical protein